MGKSNSQSQQWFGWENKEDSKQMPSKEMCVAKSHRRREITLIHINKISESLYCSSWVILFNI